MSATPRVLAVLNLSPHIPDLIKQGYVCLLGFTGSPVLSNATSILASFATNLAALDAANKAAATRAAGLIQTRDGKRPAVVTNMHQLRSTVQAIADGLPPDQAEALILSAGMSVKKITKRVKHQYEVKQGAGSGLVTLTAEVAARHATYQWQMSTDQKSWTNLALTFRSKTHLGGLTTARNVSIASRHEPGGASTARGAGWSPRSGSPARREDRSAASGPAQCPRRSA